MDKRGSLTMTDITAYIEVDDLEQVVDFQLIYNASYNFTNTISEDYTGRYLGYEKSYSFENNSDLTENEVLQVQDEILLNGLEDLTTEPRTKSQYHQQDLPECFNQGQIDLLKCFINYIGE